MLLPTDPDNYYRERDIVPADLFARLGEARIVIANYHAFLPRERGDGSRLTKAILAKGERSPFVESPDQMVRRVCRELGGKKQIIVLNDEAHHCYRPKAAGRPGDSSPDDAPARTEKLTGDDRVEAKQRDEEARVWMTGLEAMHRKLGIRTVLGDDVRPEARAHADARAGAGDRSHAITFPRVRATGSRSRPSGSPRRREFPSLVVNPRRADQDRERAHCRTVGGPHAGRPEAAAIE